MQKFCHIFATKILARSFHFTDDCLFAGIQVMTINFRVEILRKYIEYFHYKSSGLHKNCLHSLVFCFH